MTPPRPAVPGDQPITLQLTATETNLILTALSELPFKVSFRLIQKIKQQGDQQTGAIGVDAVDPTAISTTPPSITGAE